MTSPEPTPERITIGLVDRCTGWQFRLHSEDRRVWLEADGTLVPVPLDFVSGRRAREFETAAGNCRDAGQLLALSSEILLDTVCAVPLGLGSAGGEARARC